MSALAKLAWWGKFIAEIEAIGGRVKNPLMVAHDSDVELEIPEDKIDAAREIMTRYWDPSAKCARAVCYSKPEATHTQTGERYCIPCARKINAGAKALGFAGNLVTWPELEARRVIEIADFMNKEQSE